MPTLLVVEVSPRADQSISRSLTARFVRRWRDTNPSGEVIFRDLVTSSLPFIDLAWINGAFSPPALHSPESAAAMKVSSELIAELQAADHFVIGTPMHNLMIPASLKTYVDHIIRIGVTVSDRNEGLVTGKKGAVIIASGGDFSPGSTYESLNLASPYLRLVLGFIGIKDLQFLHAGPTRAIMEGREEPGAFLDRFDAGVQTITTSWLSGD